MWITPLLYWVLEFVLSGHVLGRREEFADSDQARAACFTFDPAPLRVYKVEYFPLNVDAKAKIVVDLHVLV